MSTIEDGGTAFPCHGPSGQVFQYGMTLRDYFAAAALQGLLTNPECSWTLTGVLSVQSYKLADAMLAARKEGKQP